MTLLSPPLRKTALALAALAAVAVSGWYLKQAAADNGQTVPAAAKPSLAVVAVQPSRQMLPYRLEANGNIAAWQEASIGAETGDLRLAEVRAEAGDTVKRGQVLALFASEIPQAELAQARAVLAEAEAAAKEAAANAARARSVQASGALSAQQIGQYLSAEAAAQARVQSAQANLALAELRLRHTQVLASDDGVISLRNPQITLGAVVPQGQELFRLIRRNRLEWRAEVTAEELSRLRPGLAATVKSASGAEVQGRVRRIAPTVDAQTRNALIYVDLPAGKEGGFKPGMFARGEFALGSRSVMTVPRQALVVRDGFSYVFLIDADHSVRQTKVAVGAQFGDVVEIRAGLAVDARLAGSGAGFLNDGDRVRLVSAAAAGSNR